MHIVDTNPNLRAMTQRDYEELLEILLRVTPTPQRRKEDAKTEPVPAV